MADLTTSSGEPINVLPAIVISNLVLVAGVPATSTSAGTTGQVAMDKDFLYFCYEANKWSAVRVYSDWTKETQ